MSSSFGLKICDRCNTVYTEHGQFLQCPHDYKADVEDRHDQTIKALFHKLWRRDVHTPGYEKKDWMELWRLLQARGIDV